MTLMAEKKFYQLNFFQALIVCRSYELKIYYIIKILVFYQDCVKNLLDSLIIRYVIY